MFGEFSYIYEREKAVSVVKSSKLGEKYQDFQLANQGGEVRCRKLRIAVGTVVVAMNDESRDQ